MTHVGKFGELHLHVAVETISGQVSCPFLGNKTNTYGGRPNHVTDDDPQSKDVLCCQPVHPGRVSSSSSRSWMHLVADAAFLQLLIVENNSNLVNSRNTAAA